MPPEQRSYADTYAAARRAFPSLGLYACASPRDLQAPTPLVGDALDDIADIARTMDEVVWLFENEGHARAAGHFRYWFEMHWGRHLHDLRGCLHAEMFEQP